MTRLTILGDVAIHPVPTDALTIDRASQRPRSMVTTYQGPSKQTEQTQPQRLTTHSLTDHTCLVVSLRYAHPEGKHRETARQRKPHARIHERGEGTYRVANSEAPLLTKSARLQLPPLTRGRRAPPRFYKQVLSTFAQKTRNSGHVVPSAIAKRLAPLLSVRDGKHRSRSAPTV